MNIKINEDIYLHVNEYTPLTNKMLKNKNLCGIPRDIITPRNIY